MTRVLLDPSALIGGMAGPGWAGGLSMASGALDAFSQFSGASAQSNMIKADANAARIQGDRALRDFQLDSERQFGRIMALAGAGGLSMDSADIIVEARGEMGRGAKRIKQDTKMRQRSLLASSRATRQRGFVNLFSDLSSSAIGAVDRMEKMA